MSRWLRVAEEGQYRTIVVTEFDPIIKSEDIIGKYRFPFPKGNDDIKYPSDEYVDNYIKSRYSGENINWYDESEYNAKLEAEKQKELEREREIEAIEKLWETPEGKIIYEDYNEYKEAKDWLEAYSDPDSYDDLSAMQEAWDNDPKYDDMKFKRDLAYSSLLDSLIKTTNPIFQKFIEERLGITKEEAKQRHK